MNHENVYLIKNCVVEIENAFLKVNGVFGIDYNMLKLQVSKYSKSIHKGKLSSMVIGKYGKYILPTRVLK